MRIVKLLAATAVAFGLALAAPAQASAQDPTAPGPPPGANDWSCKPTPEHPRPVVLVHGLMSNQSANWPSISPLLADAGYCVFSLTHGVNPVLGNLFPFNQMGGMTRIELNSAQVAAFVDKVRAATGAGKVDLVGASEGTVVSGYFVKFLGGAAKVKNIVAIVPVWHGSTVLGLSYLIQSGEQLGVPVESVLAVPCEACPQLLAHSEFIAKLNSGGSPAVPGVRYTNVMTKWDEFATPYTTGYIIAPNATNHVIQDYCESDHSEHNLATDSPVTHRLILNALDPANAKPAGCQFAG